MTTAQIAFAKKHNIGASIGASKGTPINATKTNRITAQRVVKNGSSNYQVQVSLSETAGWYNLPDCIAKTEGDANSKANNAFYDTDIVLDDDTIPNEIADIAGMTAEERESTFIERQRTAGVESDDGDGDGESNE